MPIFGVVSFVFGGMIETVKVLSVSELSTAIPKAGSDHYYTNKSLGSTFSSIAGLGVWVGLAFSSPIYRLSAR